MKKSKKIICVSVAGVMVASSLPVFADVTKSETVYVNLNGQGDVDQVIVSDWIHSDEAGVSILDKSFLENIINVKGDELPVKNGETLEWTMAGEDLFYQGTTNKELPLDIKVSYYLDGKEILGTDLVGKSGHVEIHLEIINKESLTKNINGTERTLYTPFETVSVVTLPMDKFTGIKANTGKIINDGNNNILTYVAIPGLSTTLGDDADFMDVPESLIIEADVQEFEMAPIMITALSKFPEIEDLENMDKMSDLINAVDKLNDAALDLLDASTRLNEGQQTFYSKVGEYKKGVETFSTGVNGLFDGLAKLGGGVNQAHEGSKKLSGGLTELKEKSQALIGGLEEFAKGGKSFADNAVAFSDGAKKLADATTGLTQNTTALYNGALKVSNGAKALQDGQAQITGGLNKSVEGVSQLKAMVGQTKGEKDPLYVSLAELEKNLKALEMGSKNLESGMSDLNDGQTQVVNGLEKLDSGVKQIKPVAEKLSQGGQGLVAGAEKLSGAATQIQAGSESFGGAVSALAAGASDLEKGIGQLADGLSKANAGKGQLTNGQKQLTDATGQLLEGARQLAEGQDKFNDGMRKFQTEGTGKMVRESQVATDSLEVLMDVKDELAKMSKDYNTFSGVGDNMEGQVKFVMKTESLKMPKKVVAVEKTNKEESKGFIAWVKSFFE